MSLHFFALRTEKLDVQEQVFAIDQISILFFALFRICELSVQFVHTGIAIFTLVRKMCVLQYKNCNVLAIFGFNLEQC